MAAKDDKLWLKQSFVHRFVDAMYVILLGVGITNIVASQKFESLDLTHGVSALLIIGVVISYWWDWVDGIEEVISPTFFELLIDVGILLVFALMLANYSNLKTVSVLFVVLGFGDLVWVINHGYTVRSQTGSFDSRFRYWIRRKLLVIVIYGAALLAVHKVLLEVYQLISLSIAFFAVRTLGFPYVKKLHNKTFRLATSEDLSELATIHNEQTIGQCRDDLAHGFLLNRTDCQKLASEFSNRDNIFWVVTVNGVGIVGYVHLSKTIELSVVNDLQWKDQKESSLIENARHHHVKTIVVKKDWERRGIGEHIYEKLFDTYKNDLFSAFVALKPHKNSASLLFHKKCGFLEKAKLQKDNFESLKDYESILFIKDCWRDAI